MLLLLLISLLTPPLAAKAKNQQQVLCPPSSHLYLIDLLPPSLDAVYFYFVIDNSWSAEKIAKQKQLYQMIACEIPVSPRFLVGSMYVYAPGNNVLSIDRKSLTTSDKLAATFNETIEQSYTGDRSSAGDRCTRIHAVEQTLRLAVFSYNKRIHTHYIFPIDDAEDEFKNDCDPAFVFKTAARNLLKDVTPNQLYLDIIRIGPAQRWVQYGVEIQLEDWSERSINQDVISHLTRSLLRGALTGTASNAVVVFSNEGLEHAERPVAMKPPSTTETPTTTNIHTISSPGPSRRSITIHAHESVKNDTKSHEFLKTRTLDTTQHVTEHTVDHLDLNEEQQIEVGETSRKIDEISEINTSHVDISSDLLEDYLDTKPHYLDGRNAPPPVARFDDRRSRDESGVPLSRKRRNTTHEEPKKENKKEQEDQKEEDNAIKKFENEVENEFEKEVMQNHAVFGYQLPVSTTVFYLIIVGTTAGMVLIIWAACALVFYCCYRGDDSLEKHQRLEAAEEDEDAFLLSGLGGHSTYDKPSTQMVSDHLRHTREDRYQKEQMRQMERRGEITDGSVDE